MPETVCGFFSSPVPPIASVETTRKRPSLLPGSLEPAGYRIDATSSQGGFVDIRPTSVTSLHCFAAGLPDWLKWNITQVWHSCYSLSLVINFFHYWYIAGKKEDRLFSQSTQKTLLPHRGRSLCRNLGILSSEPSCHFPNTWAISVCSGMLCQIEG